MGASYGQFCPVAKAMELLDERWTLLLVRELVSGSQRFNELRRGLPRMSPALLSRRLQQLAAAGIVERRADGNEVRYVLTPAGHELRPIVEALGVWGTRWVGELGDRDLDPKLLLWDMRRNVDHGAVPAGRSLVRFTFRDVTPRLRHWWLVISDGDVDVCDADPGFPETVAVSAELRELTRVWRGDVSWEQALRGGGVEVSGPEPVRRALPRWFTLSVFAPTPRPAAQDPVPG